MAARRRPSQAVPNTPAYHKSFAPREPWGGVTEYGNTTIAHIKKEIEAFAHKRPNKEWAPKLLARVAAGDDTICQRAIDMAREVSRQPTEREPGSDDE